jgi:hypothetical protein
MSIRSLLKRMAPVFGVFIALLTPVHAANQTTETWQAKWAGGSCTLVMSYDVAKLAGPVSVQKPCSKALRKAKSFVYTDGKRKHMVVFAEKGGKGKILASFDRSGKNKLKGKIGNTGGVTMFLSSSSSVSVNVGAGASANSSNAASCVRYANNQKCARKADLKNPKIEVFKTINMRSLAKQSIFPFSGGGGFANDEKMAKSACMVVKKCEQAFNSSEMWCEVVLSDGFFTGWVKRMDDNFVYLRKGC